MSGRDLARADSGGNLRDSSVPKETKIKETVKRITSKQIEGCTEGRLNMLDSSVGSNPAQMDACFVFLSLESGDV